MHYYKYKFVSPDELYARIKEEMRSYFDTGMVDDLMFPIWTKKCLQKLGRSSLPIHQALLFMDNFEARLPPDFVAPRECWLTTELVGPEIRRPGSFYQQITTVLNKPYDVCNPEVNCDPCNPDIITVVAKTNTYTSQSIGLSHLLTPGTITVGRDYCNLSGNIGYLNHNNSSADTFDIRDGKLVTNFRCGDIFMLYYAVDSDDCRQQLIPENFRIQEFIEAFLKQKLFEQIFNQITDETFNQSQAKYLYYKQLADEAYITAETEIKKKTIYEKVYAIRRDQQRLAPYERMIYRGRGRRGYGGWPWGVNNY